MVAAMGNLVRKGSGCSAAMPVGRKQWLGFGTLPDNLDASLIQKVSLAPMLDHDQGIKQ